LPRDLEFFTERHRGAWTLLTVAESRVKNNDPVFFHIVVSRFDSSTKNPVATGSGVYEMLGNKFKPLPHGHFPEAPVPAVVGGSNLPSRRKLPATPSQVNRFFPNRFAVNTVNGKA
jgi:hypothetical protein